MTSPRTESFVLVQEMGDLHDELDSLTEQWDDLTDEQAESDGGRALAAEIVKRQEQVKAAAIHGKFVKQGFMAWEAMKGDYPPGDGDNADLGWASFTSEFWQGAIHRCILEPTFTEDEWAAIWDRVSPADRVRLAQQVNNLHEFGWSIPKPRRPLPATTPPASASKRQRGSA